MLTNETIQRGDEVEVISHLTGCSHVLRGIVRSSTSRGIYVTGKGWGHLYNHNSACTEINLLNRHGLMNFRSLLKLADSVL
ncbi:hypothetical protein [Vibrio sp. 10N.239.312.D08]|uniref:hypothetical protein n=1 Tax=Vibrio sp. 10N.239.312.D08 TaxID=3229978 RepID=UPI00354E35C5